MPGVRDFVVHLRWPYQVLILPAGYLLGGLFSPDMDWARFLLQFAAVHLLLNGGVTAYNSFFDQDTGPVGGLERPPPMAPWMLWAALAVQALGLAIAAPLGWTYAGIYATTMLLSVLYSAPPFRWKGHPIGSLVAVAVGTGTNTFLLGYLAAAPDQTLDRVVLAGAAGVATTLLSMYPVSQAFQIEVDRARGDRTFAVAHGTAGIRRVFAVAYPLGTLILTLTIETRRPGLGLLFGGVGAAGGIVLWSRIRRLAGAAAEYRPVMQIKYLASFLFSAFVAACLVVVHRS